MCLSLCAQVHCFQAWHDMHVHKSFVEQVWIKFLYRDERNSCVCLYIARHPLLINQLCQVYRTMIEKSHYGQKTYLYLPTSHMFEINAVALTVVYF